MSHRVPANDIFVSHLAMTQYGKEEEAAQKQGEDECE